MSDDVRRDHAGLPDRWERLWTPHRQPYLSGESRPAHDGPGDECPFCRAPQMPEDEGLVVQRGIHAYVVMNLFPYNAGHLLVCPYRHVPDYTDLTPEEVLEIGELTQRSMEVLRATTRAHGFNIGINQGKVGGAGIAGHLHQHVVPRWGGDTNFLPVIGHTKTMPQVLEESRQILQDAWAKAD
ncbi:MAG: HIT domain-containing protein [Actinomycetales bacterium]|nr:HIT domain-containing protein [Actinomycetales bacterium]